MEEYFKSIVDQDRTAIVICNLDHIILYMNKSAIERYEKRGGRNLIGRSLLDCHNPNSNEMIKKIVDWFMADKCNNMIYTFKNETENKDVYMVALRDESGRLIGYYEKHEYRNHESTPVYDFSKSLV